MQSPIGARVLVTGGAGFLGRAILERAEREQWDTEFTIYSRDEEKQWRVRNRWPNTRCVLGDINDVTRLCMAISGHDTVLHLAAHKFVPEAERDVIVAVTANVLGTKSVAEACQVTRVPTAILISTDKASDPVNLYGLTKATAERIWGEMYRTSKNTAFRVARYGNVIGSTGSVLPHFVNLLRHKQPLTITDWEMTRFMMPVDEAIDAIIAARDGNVFMVVPSPKAATLYEIAGAAAIVAGTRDTPYNIIGLRPGEKMHETLISRRETRLVKEFVPPHYRLVPEYDAMSPSLDMEIASNSTATIRLSAQEIADYYRAVELL